MPTEHLSGGSAIETELLNLFLYLGTQWVLYLLLILSVLSVAIAVERFFFFFLRRGNFYSLQKNLNDLLAANKVDEAREFMANNRSHVAVVIRSGLEALPRGPAAVEEVMASTTQLERLRMERGLAFLGTLGNNAPFLGLFGTVLGIIRAFRDLALDTTGGSSAVMAGIAEALIATAVGLLVALPAVVFYNAFQRGIRSQLTASDAMVRVVMAHAKEHKE